MNEATINLTILPDQKSMCTVMLLFVHFSIAIDSSVRCFGDVHSNFSFISLHISDETFVQVAQTRVQVTTMVCSQMQGVQTIARKHMYSVHRDTELYDTYRAKSAK